jgi:peptidoglycan/LPS O-acetylase OafA/YrhL
MSDSQHASNGSPAAVLPFHAGLEGLRGLSVAVVLLFHAGASWCGGGFLGVSTFFTLSGFVITRLLLHEWETTHAVVLTRFWGRRLRRLMPASLFALLAIAILGGLYGDVMQRERLAGDGFAALAYVANWWFIFSGAEYAALLGSPAWTQHFWSLAIEEQYYVVYPLAAAALLRATGGSRRILAVVLAAGSVVSWVWMAVLSGSDVPTARIYFGTDARAGELLAGGLLAVVLAGRELPTSTGSKVLFTGLGGLGLACSIAFWSEARVESGWLYEAGFGLYALVSMSLIAASVQSGGPLVGLLSLRPLRWLGRVSYGVYLYHWPIFLWLDPERIALSGAPLLLTRLVLTFVVAECSYRWLEEPIRRGRGVLGWQRLAAPPVAVAAVAFAFAFTPDGPLGRHTRSAGRASMNAITLGEESVRVLIVGDSFAASLVDGLSEFGLQTGSLEVIDATMRGCGIALGAWPGSVGRSKAFCNRWPNHVAARIRGRPPDVALVSTAAWDLVPRERAEWGGKRIIGDPDFDRWLRGEYEYALGLLSSSGARIVWLNSPCVTRRGGAIEGVYDPERSMRLDRDILKPLAEANPDRMERIDLAGKLCPRGKFTNELDGVPDLRPDGIHLSPAGSTLIGRWLGPQLLAAAKRAPAGPK